MVYIFHRCIEEKISVFYRCIEEHLEMLLWHVAGHVGQLKNHILFNNLKNKCLSCVLNMVVGNIVKIKVQLLKFTGSLTIILSDR